MVVSLFKIHSKKMIKNNFCNRRPAKIRRQQKMLESLTKFEPNISTHARDRFNKNLLPIKVFKRDPPHTNYLNSDVFDADDTVNDISLSPFPINVSDSMSLKSSTHRNSGVNITRITTIERPVKIGNAWIKSPDRVDNNEATPPKRQSAVTVKRVNKSLNLNETDNQSQSIDQKVPSTSASKTGGVNVTKVLRQNVNTDQLVEVPSTSHVNVSKLSKPIINKLKTVTSAKSQKPNQPTVVKLSRNSAKN